MYNGKKFLGLIPARGGSKGIPHKNIKDLCGKPLIAYTIEAGLKSKYIDYLLVSTDDKVIADIARNYGASVPFLRPAELAEDTSKTIDVVVHAIEKLKNMGMTFDTLVLLQPTQPLRTSYDIDQAVETYIKNHCEPLVSVSPVDDHPLLIRSIKDDRLIPLINASSTCRRQDMELYYRVNGCIYINEVDCINENTSFNDNVVPYIMEKEHSVDIDDPCDLVIAQYYMDKSNYE